MKLLDRIESPADVRDCSVENLERLACEIREFLLESISETGGHLASNLGAVELTLALHHVFESPKDKIIFDVGHQAYTHKIITGRKDRMHTLRQLGGLSGFLKPMESEHDFFGAGHASTSLSAAYAVAFSNRVQKKDGAAVAVIGDGAFTGGLCFEALNLIGEKGEDVLIVLNDNEMSIDRNVGALNMTLTDLRTYKGYNRLKSSLKSKLSGKSQTKISKFKKAVSRLLIPSNIFEGFGLRYFGPFDGHDMKKLVTVFEKMKRIQGPKVVHLVTQKGKGYIHAEEEPDFYHGVSSFEPENGIVHTEDRSFSKLFGDTLVQMAKKKENIVAISAAMVSGTGLKEFEEKFPGRFVDVGIAEENAVTSAAAMALNGLKPYVAIYSTFLQRAFDQILHDVAIQKADVVLCIDRSGLVGQDGETHQGIYDVGYLSLIPGMKIWAPKDAYEFQRMLEASYNTKGPLAIRYPRDKVYYLNEDDSPVEKLEFIGAPQESKTLVLSYGRTLGLLWKLQKEMKFDLLNHRVVWPLQLDVLNDLIPKYEKVFVIEEVVYSGSLSQKLKGIFPHIQSLTLPDAFIDHGDMKELLEIHGFSVENLKKVLGHYED